MDEAESLPTSLHNEYGKATLGSGVIECAPAGRETASLATSKLAKPRFAFSSEEEPGVVLLLAKTT